MTSGTGGGSVPRAGTVRAAVPRDLPAIGRLGALLVRTHHEFDPQRFIAATPQTAEGYGAFLGTQLDAPDALVLVADPSQRGHGVGRMLLDAALAELEARGAPRMVLSTAARNEAAQRLFVHAGFRRTMIEMTREAGGTV